MNADITRLVNYDLTRVTKPLKNLQQNKTTHFEVKFVLLTNRIPPRPESTNAEPKTKHEIFSSVSGIIYI